MIVLKDFHYRYPGGDDWVLKAINLEIPKGQFCAVVGANGAGKSTLCYALSGFAPHFFKGVTKGKLGIGDMNVLESSLGDLSAEVGLVFQNPFNQISGARFSVREEIAFGLENLGIERSEMLERIAQSLETVGLNDEAERSPFELSGGQQQRVAIASMLAMRPKVLVLDEPTSQLDPRGSEEVFIALRALVNEGGTTVILVEHKIEWLAMSADRVLRLDGGEIVADGSAQDVLAAGVEIGETDFTTASRLAKEGGIVKSKAKLPLTLQQGIDYFS
jgi:energy-coupling factor transporter ATP-binding protein EcfA2